MASFTTRVELHKEQPSDYETLHTEMGKVGFSRLITSDDGVSYRLPTAEYNLSGSFSRAEVLEKAKGAVKATGKDASILVTESSGRTWSNLTKVS
jgi:photosystem II stability/assembly factor-like uncharacterized protein